MSQIAAHEIKDQGLSAVVAALTTVCLMALGICGTIDGVAAGDEAPVVKPASAEQNDLQTPNTEDLLAGEIGESWQHFSSKADVALTDVWKVEERDKERNLVCLGTPKGFLFTKKSYTDFELSFEWQFTEDPNGNSGILVFTQNEPRLWPTSMQIQLHQPSAGAVFPGGDATSDNSTETTEGLAQEVGQWNTCQIRGQDGRLAVKINGMQAGEVSGCKPKQGHIAIQSEGSVTRFRRIRIRELKPSVAVAAPAAAAQNDQSVKSGDDS